MQKLKYSLAITKLAITFDLVGGFSKFKFYQKAETV